MKRKFNLSRQISTGVFVAFLSLLVTINTCLAQSGHYNVRDYGASGEKDQLATPAIQAAIDASFEAGGGVVYLPPGAYTSGTLVMKDYVTLHIEAGATLFASRQDSAYHPEFRDVFKNPVLIYADGAKHISFRGKGRIDGQAVRSYEDLKKVDGFIKEKTEIARAAGVEMKMYYRVPPHASLFYILNCTDVTLEDLTLWESTFWTFHIEKSRRIFIRGVYVYSSLESGVNSDGLDINCCQDVTISDCTIITGDDAIVLKTKCNQACENVTVTNCVLSSSSTALKLGTESASDFRHIVFSNCVIRNSNRALSIVVRDGSHVSDVIFSNITIECNRRHFNWWGDADPIWLVVTKRGGHSRVGSIENVLFENIIAHGRGTSRIEDLVGGSIRNITIRNMQLHMHSEDAPDKRATHAFYASEVENLTLDGVEVFWDTENPEPKWGSALYLENISGLKVNRFTGRQGLLDSNAPVIFLNNVKRAWISNSMGSEGAGKLVEVTGESEDIVMEGNEPFRRKKGKKGKR